MLWLFFPIFGFWWWIIAAVAFGWILILEECEKPAEAAGVLLCFFLVTTILGDVGRLFVWAAHHGWEMIALAVGYLGIGFFWGIFRYWWEQSLAVSKYNDKKVEFLRNRGLHTATTASEIPDRLMDDWIEQIGMDRYRTSSPMRTFFQEQKKRVINWMSWWWLSMISFILKDFVIRFYAILLNQTRVVFEAIDRQTWRGTAQDFERVERHLEAKRAEQEKSR